MQRRQTLSAWLLLAVIVPMILLTALHVHTPPNVATQCEQCAEHVCHTAHLAPSGATVDHCVLCRLLHTTMAVATATTLLAVTTVACALAIPPAMCPPRMSVAGTRGRAPPML